MEIQFEEEFYFSTRKFLVSLMGIFYNTYGYGMENIPVDRNYILVGNHLHILDSVLIATYVDDNLRFMVDNKLYRYKLWKYFFKRLGTIGINPEKLDLKAVKESLEIAKQYNLVIFPEGMTHKYEEDIAFKPGIARLAKLANALVVPFGIKGDYRLFSDLQITFGEPIDFNNIDIPKKEYDYYLEEKVRKLEK